LQQFHYFAMIFY